MLLFFKTCSVEKDIDILKIKLDRSVSLHEKVIRKRETKFAEIFPFYFVAPQLVTLIQNLLRKLKLIRFIANFDFRFCMITISNSLVEMVSL